MSEQMDFVLHKCDFVYNKEPVKDVLSNNMLYIFKTSLFSLWQDIYDL